MNNTIHIKLAVFSNVRSVTDPLAMTAN